MKLCALLGAILALVVSLAACEVSVLGESDSGLPAFAHEENGRLVVDIEDATDGQGQWGEAGVFLVDYTYGDCETHFTVQAVGHTSGIPPQPMLEELPVAMSPELEASDGVAQFIFVPVIDEDAGALYAHLFLDPEWAKLVPRETYLYMPPPFGELDFGAEPPRALLNVTADDYFHHVEKFESQESLEWCYYDFPNTLVTNVDAPYRDVLRTAQNLQLGPEDLAIWLSVRR